MSLKDLVLYFIKGGSIVSNGCVKGVLCVEVRAGERLAKTADVDLVRDGSEFVKKEVYGVRGRRHNHYSLRRGQVIQTARCFQLHKLVRASGCRILALLFVPAN